MVCYYLNGFWCCYRVERFRLMAGRPVRATSKKRMRNSDSVATKRPSPVCGRRCLGNSCLMNQRFAFRGELAGPA